MTAHRSVQAVGSRLSENSTGEVATHHHGKTCRSADLIPAAEEIKDA